MRSTNQVLPQLPGEGVQRQGRTGGTDETPRQRAQGDVVIIWNVGRLARSLRQLIDTTVLLNERDLELRSLTENINTTTPSGKLTFRIVPALAEFERDVLLQRINAGLKAALRRARRRQAQSIGRIGSEKARALLRPRESTKVQAAEELEVDGRTRWRAFLQDDLMIKDVLRANMKPPLPEIARAYAGSINHGFRYLRWMNETSMTNPNWLENERLHRAAESGDLEKVKSLLLDGLPVNAFDELSFTPLHYATAAGHIATVRYLLEAGADVNAHEEERSATRCLKQ